MRQNIHLLFCLPLRDAWPQAAIHPTDGEIAVIQDLRPCSQAGIERQRYPQVGNHSPRAGEIGWSDADNDHVDAIQLQAASNKSWISRESSLPEVVADQNDRLPGQGILFGKEGAAHRCVNPEDLKVVTRNHGCDHWFGTSGQYPLNPETGRANNPVGGRRRCADSSH